MLILTRKLGESINLGKDIKITLLGISGKQVKLGIQAPDNISIHRDELNKRTKKDNSTASLSLREDLLSVTRILKSKRKKK